MKAQARAPMTPIVKLVFGIDYDKTRLTEFAAALSNARRNAVPESGFLAFIERQPGGLKALVAAERQARRPEPRPDTRGDAAREALRTAQALSLATLASSEEFVLVLTRRSTEGGYEPVAMIDDPAMIDRAIRRSAPNSIHAQTFPGLGLSPSAPRGYSPPPSPTVGGAQNL